MNADIQYNNLIRKIQNHGISKDDRTGVGTQAVFGERMEFDISDGQLPMLTTKKVYTRLIIHELLWMLSGETNVRYLKEHGVDIWDSWVDATTAEYDESGNLMSGECPKVYGKQWRNWEDTRLVPHDDWLNGAYDEMGFECVTTYPVPENSYLFSQGGKAAVIHRKIDQIEKIIHQLKNDPDSRRIILTAWNVAEVDEMALAPCHTLTQFWTRPLSLDERLAWIKGQRIGLEQTFETHEQLDAYHVPKRALSSQLYMRSNDKGIGAPFNYVQYAILTHMLAQVCNMTTDRFVWVGGDAHVYKNQWSALSEQLTRTPMKNTAKLLLSPTVTRIDDFTFNDFMIANYQSHPPVKFPPAAV